jgi:hypothetical protein
MPAMCPAKSQGPSLRRELRQWWRDARSRDGSGKTLLALTNILWEFARESTPGRRKQRYGDIDYDWDYRVNTTGAAVSWRSRLLGLFNSPYQPTEPALFREMLGSLNFDFREFIFIDIGSGKGRALLMAADFPFRRILGVELLHELDRIAQENIRNYRSDSQLCFELESVCADAREFEIPAEPLVLYLFNPLPEAGLLQLLDNLERSIAENPRSIYLLYHNPLLEHLLTQSMAFEKLHGTQQFSIYQTRTSAK